MKNRRYFVQHRKVSTYNYLDLKGVPRENRREHCREFLEYLTKIEQPMEDFTWFKFFTISEGFYDVFSYFTKEKYGWENARVPKENYKF